MTKKICWCILIILTLGLTCINYYFEKTEHLLASSVIRLHVIANSNQAEDQNLKLKVRDRILSETGTLFEPGADIISAKKNISDLLPQISRIARETVHDNGYNYDIKVSFGKSNFPTKEYGALILPTGNYEAVKIEIGEAEGRNWWCVLFPPLCFVDESCVSANTDAIESIETKVGKRNSSMISTPETTGAQIKFRTYELWQKSRQKLLALLD